MNDYKLFTQRIGLIGIVNLVGSLSGIIMLPILTKTLPIEEYGAWIQIMVTIGLIPPIAVMGLPYTMVRFLAAEKDKKEIQNGFYSIATFILFISLIISLLLFLFSKPFAATFLDNRIELVKIVSLIIPIQCLNAVCLEFFRTFQQIKRYSLFTLIQTYGNVALVAYAVLNGYGIFGAVVAVLIVQIITFLLTGSLIVTKIGVKIPNFSRMKEYLSFGLPTVPGNLSSWVVNSSDRYLIGYFLGVAFVGYYSPGYTLGNIINMFMAPLAFMLPAVLSKYYDENNMNEVKTVLRYSLKYFLALAIPSTFGLSLLSKPILTILSTPEIAAQGYLITPFVAASALLLGAAVASTQGLYLAKRTDIGGKIWIIAAISNLGLNIVFVPYIGIIGAAITTLIAFTLVLILATYYSLKYIRFDIDFSSISKSVFASIVMSLVIIMWSPIGLFNVLAVIGVCAVVYAAILLLLKGFKKEEFRFFRELFRI